MTKLSDTQLVLLSTASQRDNGSLIPLPDTLIDKENEARKAIASLIKAKLVEEGVVGAADLSWRAGGDTIYGVRITDAGLSAIGAKDDADQTEAQSAELNPVSSTSTGTKTGKVLELLQRDEGATLDELIEATGWLPHTTRAALTGIRKKGHPIEKSKRGDTTCYRVAA